MTLAEVAVIVADAALTSLMYMLYRKSLKTYKTVENTQENILNAADLIHLVQSSTSAPYVCISGEALPIKSEHVLFSQYQTGVLGVLQRLVTKEHKSRRVHGYWTDTQKVIGESINTVPFAIQRDDVTVQVAHPLTARFIRSNLTVVHDVFNPRSPGVVSIIVDRMLGDVSKGYRDTEKMLKVGSNVIGFGHLVLESGLLTLQSPKDNSDLFIITALSRGEILKYLYDDVTFYRVLTGIFALVGVGIVYIYARKAIDRTEDENNFYQPIRVAREGREAARRSESGDNNAVEDNDNVDSRTLCVICINKPKEIVVLNCGHICMCADCADLLPQPRKCPICRQYIARLVATYNS